MKYLEDKELRLYIENSIKQIIHLLTSKTKKL